MAIRMIAADMDGTLLDEHKQITPRTRAAVATAMERGVAFVLNTGRMPESVTPFARQLQVNAPIICYNGALTYDVQKGQASACVPLKRETAVQVLRMAEGMGLHVQGYWGKSFYCQHYNAKAKAYEEKCCVQATVVDEPLSQMIPCDAYKLLIILDPGQMPQVLPQFVEAFSHVACCAASSTTFIEVVNVHANKGTALCALGAQYGIDAQEIMAFGDELNDLSMLTMAGYGYAMGNAPENVRQKAHFVAPANTQDGLAQIIERFAQDNLLAPAKRGDKV